MLSVLPGGGDPEGRGASAWRADPARRGGAREEEGVGGGGDAAPQCPRHPVPGYPALAPRPRPPAPREPSPTALGPHLQAGLSTPAPVAPPPTFRCPGI